MSDERALEDFTAQIKGRFVRSFLDILILRLIEAGPKWGYDIIKKTEADYQIKLRHGALYPLLNRLEADGFLESRKEIRKGRVRKVYIMTPTGEEALRLCQDFLRQQTS